MKVRYGLVMCVLVAVVLYQAFARTAQGQGLQVIRASSIELVDANGVVRTEIGPGRITFLGPEGHRGTVAAGMSVHPEGKGSMLALKSTRGQFVIRCGWRPDMQAERPRYRDQVSFNIDNVVVRDGVTHHERSDRFFLDLSGDTPVLTFYDGAGEVRHQVP